MDLATQFAASENAPFVPAAVTPPERVPALWKIPKLSLSNPLETWPKLIYEQPVWRTPVGPTFIMEPDAIRRVFLDEADNFWHGELFLRLIRPVWGEGLLSSQGPAWRWQRHAAAPAFRPAQVGSLVPTMSRAARTTLDRWKAEGPGARVEIGAAMTGVTYDVIVDTMLSGGEGFDRNATARRVKALIAQMARMKLSFYLAPDGHHRGRTMALDAEAEALKAEVLAMVRRRRSEPREDLVGLLMAASDPETGQAMDDAVLADNILGFIAAGHETTAVSLTWALYLAAADPPTAERIRAEVAGVAGEDPIAADHLPRLAFTRAVLQETMRLYPVGHTLTRVARRATTLAGVPIKAGGRVLVPVYALHRHRAYWRDPDVFDPERFMPGAEPPDRYVYLPFGAGPRICAGAAFAMAEAVTILATLLRGARFELEPGHDATPVAGLSLHPRGGMPMRVTVPG